MNLLGPGIIYILDLALQLKKTVALAMVFLPLSAVLALYLLSFLGTLCEFLGVYVTLE